MGKETAGGQRGPVDARDRTTREMGRRDKSVGSSQNGSDAGRWLNSGGVLRSVRAPPAPGGERGPGRRGRVRAERRASSHRGSEMASALGGLRSVPDFRSDPGARSRCSGLATVPLEGWTLRSSAPPQQAARRAVCQRCPGAPQTAETAARYAPKPLSSLVLRGFGRFPCGALGRHRRGAGESKAADCATSESRDTPYFGVPQRFNAKCWGVRGSSRGRNLTLPRPAPFPSSRFARPTLGAPQSPVPKRAGSSPRALI